MDETEDEEVKRNCYGKKLKYESSSDESDSDSDNETEDRNDGPESESPAKLVRSVLEAKCFGKGIFRPVARSLSFPTSEDDNEEDVEMSNDESSLSDERSFCSEIGSGSDASDDDQCSEPESDLESTCENTDSEVESVVLSDNDQSDSDCLSIRNEVSMSDEESSISEQHDFESSIEVDDSTDPKDSEDEVNDDLNVEIEFQSSCDEEFVLRHLSRSDSRCSVDLLDIEVENLIGEKETMTFIEHEGSGNIGIQSKGEIINTDLCTNTGKKRKFSPDRCAEIVSPDLSEVVMKKNRSTLTLTTDGSSVPPMFPCISSLSSDVPLPTVLAPRVKVRETSPPIDEQEIYDQLAEELSGGMLSPVTLESDPVPFLTPPASPITILGDDGETICEWPSNLVVDSAYSSAIELRSLSPSSLVNLEVKDKTMFPLILPIPRRIRTVSEVGSTT